MMKVERIEASRHKKGRILVFLEDGACLKITEQDLLNFGLRSGDELSDETVKRLKEAAGISSIKAAAADLIGKRAMSRASLERKLKEKGATEAEARYAAEWLEAIGAIDDADYAGLLAHHYSRRGYGVKYIQQKLYEKGVPRELWDDALCTLPPAEDVASQFLKSKLRGQEPDEKAKKNLTDALLRRGFSWSDARSAWNQLNSEIS